MEQEIEIKFDIPKGALPEMFMSGLTRYLSTKDWSIIGHKKHTRKFKYFDNPKYSAFKGGETIREVTGFDGIREGKFRYDYKKGSIDDRLEHNEWSDEELEPKQIYELLNLGEEYKDLEISAKTETSHLVYIAEKNGTRVKINFDSVASNTGGSFKELEFELEEGDEEVFEDMAYNVQDVFELDRVRVQKYFRILEKCPLYATKKFDSIVE